MISGGIEVNVASVGSGILPAASLKIDLTRFL